MEFEYGHTKSQRNQAKHGIDFQRARALWEDPRRVEFVARFSDEPRWGIVAQLDNRIWTAIYTTRKDRIRIISVRRARKYEETLYYDSTGV